MYSVGQSAPRRALEHERDERPVSSKSIFGDDSWFLDNLNPAAGRCVIHWTRPFPSGKSLQEPQNLSLLVACKEYIYLRLRGEGRLKALKADSARGHAQALLTICDWMLSAGIDAFKDITQYEVDQLREFIKARTGRWNYQAKRHVGTPPLNRTVELTLDPLRAMVTEHESLSDVPDWNPALDQGRLDDTNKEQSEIPAISDDVAVPLFAEALRWVTEIGPALVKAKDTISKSYQEDFGLKKLSELTIGGIGRRSYVALKTVTELVFLNGEEIRLSSLSKHQFNFFVQMLEAACFIVIAGFTGMRISELSGIETTCLEVRRTSNNQQLLWIKSRLVKTVPGEPEPNAWVAGPDSPENPVRMAVEIARSLASFERSVYEVDSLFITNASAYKRYGSKRPKRDYKHDLTPRSMTSTAMNRRLNSFLDFVAIKSPCRITTHQFRKTFARFAARNHRLAPLALRRHFKHVSLAMTMLYHGTDLQLLELMSEERRLEAEEALMEILGSAYLGGKMGEQIIKRNERFRGHAGEIALKSYVRTLMNNGDVPMISTAIGFCFAFHDTARCGMDAAKQGFEGCLPCSNFIIANRHLPAWQERLEMMDQFREQMVAGEAWSDVREADWERRRKSTVGVIEGLERKLKEGQGG